MKWFVPPVVIPAGLAAVVLGLAIYNYFAGS